jgi:hypothetical protein
VVSVLIAPERRQRAMAGGKRNLIVGYFCDNSPFFHRVWKFIHNSPPHSNSTKTSAHNVADDVERGFNSSEWAREGCGRRQWGNFPLFSRRDGTCPYPPPRSNQTKTSAHRAANDVSRKFDTPDWAGEGCGRRR